MIGARFGRFEAVVESISIQIRSEDDLGPWANRDCPVLAVMLRFVSFGNVEPNIAQLFNVSRSYDANFTGSGTSQALELHHVGDRRR